MSKTKDLMDEVDDLGQDLTKGAMLSRALGVAFAVFFFAVFLFIGVVVLFAKLATKIGSGGAQ